MSAKLLTEDLINSTISRTLAPISRQTYQDANIIQFLNEEMGNYIVPQIQKIREDLFMHSTEIQLVSNLPKYRIPERASGDALKLVFWKDSGDSRRQMPRVKVSDLDRLWNQGGNIPSGIFLEGSWIRVVPVTNISGQLEVWYYQRPNELVLTSKVGGITAVSSSLGSSVFTVDTNLINDLAIGQKIDFLSSSSPFVLWAQDVVITAISSTQITVDTSAVSDESSTVMPQIGDYICPARKANIPQIPQEFHPVLAQAVACRLLQGLGDLNKEQSAQATRDRMMQECLSLVENRIEDSPEVVFNKNGLVNRKRFGWARGGAFY